VAWASCDHYRPATDTVTIAQDAVRGRTDGDVTSFRGIPFAAPPLGELRWRPPAAPLGWEGFRDATRFGPSPIQPETPSDPVEQSEDASTSTSGSRLRPRRVRSSR
jgi:para-nitrobenzyl esterase